MKLVPRSWRLAMLAGTALVIIATLLIERPWAGPPRDGVVLEVPLAVVKADGWRGEFQTDETGTYDLVIAISNVTDDDAAQVGECLLGGRRHPETDCLATRSVVDLTWQLQPRQQQVGQDQQYAGKAAGEALAMSYSAELIERHVSAFPAHAGDSFILSMSSGTDVAPLAPFEPRVRVRPSTMLIEELAMRAAVWNIVGVLLALSGLWVIAVGFVVRHRERAV